MDAPLRGLILRSGLRASDPLDRFTILIASNYRGAFLNTPSIITSDNGIVDVSWTPTSVVLDNFHAVLAPTEFSVVALTGAALLTGRWQTRKTAATKMPA